MDIFLADLALLMGLSPAEAVALPVAVERAAALVELTVDRFVARCFDNAELREYLASVCRSVTG